MNNIEDILAEAYETGKPDISQLAPSGRVSLRDFLHLYCADKRDLQKHGTVMVFVSSEDYTDVCPEDKDKMEDGRTLIIALAPKTLLMVVAVPSILKDGEVVLCSGDEKAFSDKLVLG